MKCCNCEKKIWFWQKAHWHSADGYIHHKCAVGAYGSSWPRELTRKQRQDNKKY